MSPSNKKLVVAAVIGTVVLVGGVAYWKYTSKDDEDELSFDVAGSSSSVGGEAVKSYSNLTDAGGLTCSK